MTPRALVMVSPAEPAHLRAQRTDTAGIAWTSNPITEQYGVDFLWSAQGQLWGVQRKQFPEDYLASRGDRLVRELQQMQSLQERFLLLEGFGQWLPNGFLRDEHAQFQLVQLTELLISIQVRSDFDASFLWVPAPEHTMATLQYLVRWSLTRDTQSSLTRRTKPKWGTAESRDWKRFFLQGIEGVGPTTADAILDDFSGEIPMKLSCDEKRLRKIPGVGPKLASRMSGLFAGQKEQA